MYDIIGIYTYLYASPDIDSQELQEFRDTSVYGQNNATEWISQDRRVYLRHSSIQKLEQAGRFQLIKSPDSRYVLSFNGKLENSREFREELNKKGSGLDSCVDAAIVLGMYAEYGLNMFAKIKGQFELSLWDDQKKKFFLARSSCKSPGLYYTDDGWRLQVAAHADSLIKQSKNQPPDILSVPAGKYIQVGETGIECIRSMYEISPRLKNEARQRKKVLALVTDAFDGKGGIAQYNTDFFYALTASEEIAKVLILPRYSGNESRFLPPKAVQLKSKKSKIAYILTAVWVALTQGPFDLIWCGHIHFSPLAYLLAFFIKKPFWVQLFGVDAWDEKRFLTILSAKKAQKILSISRFTHREFLDLAHIKPEKACILPCTFDELRFKPGPKSKQLILKHSLQNKKILLTVGRLSEKEKYKGHDRVINIMPELLKEDSRWVYLIAGIGGDKNRLETLAHEKGVKHAVSFLGEVRSEDLPDLYRTSDIFVMPSTGEGFGIVFLEAMACGCPVVGCYGDGTQDPLLDGRSGFLVNPNNAQELKETLMSAYQDSTKSRESLIRFSKNGFNLQVQKLFA